MSCGTLVGRHVLLTAGPTRAPVDRVRYMANRSSGATGVAVAEAFRRAGAAVHLVYGPGTAEPPPVDVIRVETPDEMRRAAVSVIREHTPAAAILAAAVLDYVPARVVEGKIPSGGTLTVELVPTPKLIAELVRLAPAMLTVGFKLEYGKSDGELVAAARSLIERYGLSAVLANDLARITASSHPALLVKADGRVQAVAGKEAIAAAIVAHVAQALAPG